MSGTKNRRAFLRSIGGALAGVPLIGGRATAIVTRAANGTRIITARHAPMLEKTDLFQSRQDGYDTYRIPGVVVTQRGTLFAYCAARRNGVGDWVDIDIVMRRSTDAGKTWSARRTIAEQGTETVDNPLAIVDRETGAIHFLYQINYARCFYMRSDDDGLTFSKPVDITSVFEQFRPEYDWNVIAPGVGHGLQLKNGRLLVPVWLSTGGKSHRPSIVATIYSDDHGRTWQRGEIVVRHSAETPNPSETMGIQLADGRVMLNIRNESREYRRLISYSKDGATNWTRPVFDRELFEPICNASIVRMGERATQGKSRILFSNPDSRNNTKVIKRGEYGVARPRENLCIKLSYDEAKTWAISKSLEPGVAGYSDLAVGADGMIYCLYERGGNSGNMYDTGALTLARFNLEWLTDGKDSWTVK